MRSLYAKYLIERTDDFIIERPEGFVTYRFLNEDQVYIVDLFVVPDSRQKHIASSLADLVVELARDKKCTELLGTVVPSAKNSTISMKVLLGYGMTLKSSSNDLIIFRKEI